MKLTQTLQCLLISVEQFKNGKKDALHVEGFEVEPEFRWERHEDDPAYDPGSGNSLTCTYSPEYSYELEDLYIDLGEVRESLGLIDSDRDTVNIRIEFPNNENYDDEIDFSSKSITEVTEYIYDRCGEYIENEVEPD